MLLPKPVSNLNRLLLLGFVMILMNNCHQNGSETTEAEASSEDTTATAVVELDTSVREMQAVQAVPPPALAENFPEDQQLEFTAEDLKGLCENKYGCEEQRITPLGWSSDGKFAYFLEEANEAVQNTTIHFIIQDLSTDKRVEQQTFKASEQPGYSEDTDNYTVLSVWQEREQPYRELLEKHKVELGQGTAFISLKDLAASIPFSFTSRDQMRNNELFAIKEVDQHRLLAKDDKGAEKRIAQQRMGTYDLILKTQPLGVFKSPFEQKVAVLEGLEKRGYEGPPNVLRLQIIGCDLTQGFE